MRWDYVKKCKVELNSYSKIIIENRRQKKRQKVPLIKIKGWIASKKSSKIIRVFCINLNGLGVELYEKIEYLRKYLKQKEIDVYMISSPDWKWNNQSEYIMKIKM